jgi:hypothetical protein
MAHRWGRSTIWIKKLLAIALLLNLAIGPLAIIRLRKGLTAKPDMPVQVAYIWLLLATMLFNQ